jgi:hypothetical protein
MAAATAANANFFSYFVAPTFEATNSLTSFATSVRCAAVSCGNIGSETISAATRSVTGNSPFVYPKC